MRLSIDIIPQEIIDQYNLLPLVNNGFVYIEIRKGMYGLPQAGIVANQKLQKRLAKPDHSPHAWNKPVFGQTIQLPFPEDHSNALSSKEITRIQQIFGTML
jgi:hypothetical protein